MFKLKTQKSILSFAGSDYSHLLSKISSNKSSSNSFFWLALPGQGVLNKDCTVFLHGARPPPLVLLVLPLPENEFDEVVMQ
jgi:hypothetical protein